MSRRVDAANHLGGLLSRQTARTERRKAPDVPGPPLVHRAAPLRPEEISAPVGHEEEDYHAKLRELRSELLKEGLPEAPPPRRSGSRKGATRTRSRRRS